MFLETGGGLHNAGYITRDSSGQQVAIKVYNNSFPRVIDWNEDGKKDLLIGSQYSTPPDTGNIRVYLNVGTNSAPGFSDHFNVRAGTSALNMYMAHPTVHDLDRDGKKDLLLGEASGYVHFYKNVGTNSAPQFNANHDTLELNTGYFLCVYWDSRPMVADWQNDGAMDLMVGDYEGHINYFRNAQSVIVGEAGCAKGTNTLSVLPSPVIDQARISYVLLELGYVELDVYATSGRHIKRLLNAVQRPGAHSLTWEGCDELAAGIYFLCLSVDGAGSRRKITIIR